VQFGFFLSPVGYSSSNVPAIWAWHGHEIPARLLYSLNPMVGVVEGFRWALLGTNTAPGPMIAVSSIASVLILVGGVFYFRRMEKTFADVV